MFQRAQQLCDDKGNDGTTHTDFEFTELCGLTMLIYSGYVLPSTLEDFIDSASGITCACKIGRC